MVSPARWQRAQRYERGFWESLATRIVDGSVSQLDWYRWRADQLVRRLRSLGLEALTDGHAKVIEVGCGPVGVVGSFPAAERVAVDPLEPYYASNPALTALREPTVDYRAGAVEALPCESAHYDLAIIENCIDHVRDVHAAMSELRRVLHAAGSLYLMVNCRTAWGFVVHRALSNLRVDSGHPHTFTPPRVRDLVQDHGFKLLQFETESRTLARRDQRAASVLRASVKTLLGVSEFAVTVVAQPTHTG
jgi:SAM-dependent methyltransferase